MGQVDRLTRYQSFLYGQHHASHSFRWLGHAPVARNTAAAMAITALSAAPEDLLLFCPSDHHIPNAAAQAGAIVTFGISPTFPSTAYGCIVHGIKRRASSFNTQRIDYVYQDPQIEHANFKPHYGELSDTSKQHALRKAKGYNVNLSVE